MKHLYFRLLLMFLTIGILVKSLQFFLPLGNLCFIPPIAVALILFILSVYILKRYHITRDILLPFLHGLAGYTILMVVIIQFCWNHSIISSWYIWLLYTPVEWNLSLTTFLAQSFDMGSISLWKFIPSILFPYIYLPFLRDKS